jgi:MFS family permease
VLPVVIAVGLALRLVGAGARLSHDEGYSWLVATAPTAEAFFDRMAAFENTPPLFYALLAVLPHDSEGWLRVVSIVAGTLWIPLTYAIGRTLYGPRGALLAALMVAVAPFAVSYSDYSRAFMLAGLGLLIALLAATKLITGTPHERRWSAVFVLGAAIALWSEYYSLAFLGAFVVALLMIDRERRRRWLVLGIAPGVLFAPWLGEFARAQDNLGVTKLESVARVPTPGSMRDAIVPLVFGEHGAAGSGLLRALQAVVVLGFVLWAIARLRRPARRLLGMTLLLVPLGYFAASAVSNDVFRQRYLTALIPIGALALAGAFARTRALPVVTAACVLLGGAVAIQRTGREYEPDYARAVELAGDREIHTNSAVIAFYGRDGDVVLDRPFGMGDGRACPECAVIDDERNGGVRAGVNESGRVGPLVVGVSSASP